MNDRPIPTRTPHVNPIVLGALAVLASVLMAGTALAQSRGPLVVLGLRAPQGDDEAAANATNALRRAARAGGFEVPNDSPALEQLMASFGCDDSLPTECLAQIANDQHATRMVYGAVRRHGRGRDALLNIEVSLFDVASHTTTTHDAAEVPRAMAQDVEALAPTVQRLVGTLVPAPAPGTNPLGASGPPAGGGTGHNTGVGNTANNGRGGSSTGPIVQPGPSRPVPLRRYVGFGVAGAGVIVAAIGLGFGIDWISLNSRFGASNPTDPTVVAWQQFQVPGNDVCGASNAPSVVTSTCSHGSSSSTTGWVMGTVGVAMVAAGVVLIVTDHTGESSDHAHNDHGVHFAFTPTVSPTFQGGTLLMSF